MVNILRGEIEADLDGEAYTLCLTLGALAELETAFESETLLGVIERFQSGQMRAKDIMAVICAGLKGGGHECTLDDVALMKVEGGIEGYIAIVSKLLNAAFSFEDESAQ